MVGAIKERRRILTNQADTRAKDQAKAQLDSIVEVVKRLNHARECDGTRCDLSAKEILEGINLHYEEGIKASDEERKEYHDKEAARQAIEEDPLSVQVRSDWHSPGEEKEPSEYEILLCTGGPAVRIVGELDEYQQPTSAGLQYQDWFTPWESYSNTTNEEDEALLAYARQFYFGS